MTKRIHNKFARQTTAQLLKDMDAPIQGRPHTQNVKPEVEPEAKREGISQVAHEKNRTQRNPWSHASIKREGRTKEEREERLWNAPPEASRNARRPR